MLNNNYEWWIIMKNDLFGRCHKPTLTGDCWNCFESLGLSAIKMAMTWWCWASLMTCPRSDPITGRDWWLLVMLDDRYRTIYIYRDIDKLKDWIKWQENTSINHWSLIIWCHPLADPHFLGTLCRDSSARHMESGDVKFIQWGTGTVLGGLGRHSSRSGFPFDLRVCYGKSMQRSPFGVGSIGRNQCQSSVNELFSVANC